MCKCIEDLKQAIANVDSAYIKIIGYHEDNKEYQQAAEGAFTAELYHQYKSMIDDDKTDYYNVIDFDPVRKLHLHYDLTKERFGGKRPDLVLHFGPSGAFSRHDQRLYIEIKTSKTSRKYNSDFEKLFLAAKTNNGRKQLGFINAVFVAGKLEKDKVVKSIKKYIKDNSLGKDERLDRIYLMHFTKRTNVTYDKFKDII